MGRHRILAGGVVAIAVVAALLYLRDPPWLLSTTSGLRGWESEGGRRFRWMGGHASVFVPATARSIEIPLRTTFDRPGDWPITVRVSIDDRIGDQLVLGDAKWHSVVVRMPPPASRKVRRVDIRVDRTREDNRGAAVGEIRIQ